MHTLVDHALAQPPVTTGADDEHALYMRGLLALRKGDAEEAASLLTRALRRQPTHRGMRRNLVRALLAAEHYDQVLHQANAALAGTPDDGELHFARATALNALGQHTKACAAFARALSLRPDHAASWLNMGNASADLDDLVSAETLCRTAIRLDPHLPEAHASLGHILTLRGRLPEAIEACEAAISLRPDFAQAHWNLAIAALLSGDLPRGFGEYEWRKRHARYRADFPDLPGQRWDGGDACGRTILVRSEQGLGDVIQFARYLPLIHEAGGTPVLACAPSLVPLMRSIPGVRAVASSDRLPAYDAWVDQISLPGVYGTTLDSISGTERYLFADPILVRIWHARLPAGRRVGIALAGNPKHPADRRRSVPADFSVALPDIPGLSFVNLQHGESVGRLGLPDLTPWMTDYAETAALIDCLDLVVTVDTSVAHLAGALGKPAWVLLPHAPDWRWMVERSDSPWYRSIRLLRQPSPGDWSSVLTRVMAELGDRYAGGSTGIPPA
ncbi:tetratricopeptide repeat protein [Acidisphaera sp. S103]|uniref:tetratricopeptide repeat-containing glycosyltransferase family protein n=1 Tax=Acidisphaera sp. S103 TaxID=1747223 RepID=UPI00131AE106|nr:tetratricopeptide repeat protein [Acidisphaera sp. S103]